MKVCPKKAYPKFRRLCELASVYIKDGVIIKYRWYDEDKTSDHYLFHHYFKMGYTVGDIMYPKLLANVNVVVETNGNVVLHNFSSDHLALWMNSYEYELAETYPKVKVEMI